MKVQKTYGRSKSNKGLNNNSVNAPALTLFTPRELINVIFKCCHMVCTVHLLMLCMYTFVQDFLCTTEEGGLVNIDSDEPPAAASTPPPPTPTEPPSPTSSTTGKK
jgi:hypothetical protein